MVIEMDISNYEKSELLLFCKKKIHGMNDEDWREYQISYLLGLAPKIKLEGYKIHSNGSITFVYNHSVMLGCSDNREIETNLKMVTHVIDKIIVSDDRAIASIRLLDTPIGREVKDYLSNKTEIDRYIKIIPRDLPNGKIYRIDIVTI